MTVVRCIGFVLVLGLIAPVLAVAPAFAQQKATTNMDILLQKIKADKKLVVAANMDLSDAEAKGFWPVYDNYQGDLQALNQRIMKLVVRYADLYNNNTMSDDAAKALLEEAVAIEQAEVAMKQSYIPKLTGVLPATKVARYIQIENKIRALIRYELADGIPLVP